MSFKIPCGGFRLNEESFSLDENGVLSVKNDTQVDEDISWDDIKDRPFYDESPVLYDDYPHFAWGYAKLDMQLKEGVQYNFGYIPPDNPDAVHVFYQATPELDRYGDPEIHYIGEGEYQKFSFLLEYVASENKCYFYANGAAWREGMPAESPDGSYEYTSKLRLKISYSNAADAGVKTLDPKYLPKADAVADVSAAPTAEEFNALLAALREAGYLAE